MPRVSKSAQAALKSLLDERDRLADQVGRLYEQAEALRNRLEGLELAITLVEKGDVQELPSEAKPASNIKVLLLDLAREAKGDGLNANSAVQLAAKRGVALKRGTAASNLSRMKTDGALVHDGRRYRLPEFARSKQLFVVGDPGQQQVASPTEQVAPWAQKRNS